MQKINVQNNSDKPATKQKYTIGLRLWHWLNALIIAGSLFTILLNSTLFSVRDNAAYFKNELQQKGTTLNTEQARDLAHGLEDKVWDIHIYLGYALTFLLLFRVLVAITSKNKTGFMSKLFESFKAYKTKSYPNALHDFAVKSLYALFYVLLLIMVTTGLSIIFKKDLGLSRSFSHSIKEFHGFCMYLIIAFIALHVVGVIWAEQKKDKGIVSDMINGG